MNYSINDVAVRFKLSVHTIRFYDKKGLLPFVLRNQKGNRVFTESDLSMIQTICCLKDTGMSIRDIKKYIDLCMKGTETITLRNELLNKHKKEILKQIDMLKDNLSLLNLKIEAYESSNAVEIITERLKKAAEEKLISNIK